MGRVIVACVRNPFDPLASREVRELPSGYEIREYIDQFYPEGFGEIYEVAVSIDGQLLPFNERLATTVGDGTSLAFCAVPKGGGGGKNPWAIVAMIAVVVISIAAPYLAPAGWGTLTAAGGVSMTGAMLSAGVMIAGGLIVNSVFPPAIFDLGANTATSLEKSSTYGWEQGVNSLLEGAMLPELFGTHRITPPLIAKYVETPGDSQFLNLLYAVAGHEIDSLPGEHVRINDTEIGPPSAPNFQSVTPPEVRLGLPTQAIVPFFDRTVTDTAVGNKLNAASYVTKTTNGNSVEELSVVFTCPKGLFYANDSGGLDVAVVEVIFEYKKQGDSTWIKGASYFAEGEYAWVFYQVPTSRWYGGFWGSGIFADSTIFWADSGGSTNPGDHADGDAYTMSHTPTDFMGTPFVAVNPQWRWVAAGEWIIRYADNSSGILDYARIIGNQTAPLRRCYTARNLPPGKYDLRCKLSTAPPSGARYSNDTYWESFSEAIYDKFTYPGVALLGIRALATDQLSGGMPRVDCLTARSTVPVYNGSAYELNAANNPAWICYHLLHRAYYKGAGSRYDSASYDVRGVPASRIDYAAFHAWADWCDNPMGDGSYAHKCNIYFDSSYSLRRALDAASLNGRGVVVQMGSKFTCIVDRPEPTPVQRFLFTPGNIVRDSFAEEFLPMTDRANAIEITYWDETVDYSRQVVELYAANYDTTDREVNKTAVTLYGCSSRAQAIRHGQFLLNCNRYLTNTVSFDADVDSLACLPGDVIEVAHDVPRWGEGGRVVSSTSNTLTIDRAVAMEGGKTYKVMVKHQGTDAREEKTVSFVDATGKVLTISGSWTAIPAEHALYTFGEVDHVVKTMRVIRISRGQEMRRKISCLEYVAQVYTDGAAIPDPVEPPTIVLIANLSAVEVWRGGTSTNVVLSWSGVAPSWNVYYRKAGGIWAYASTTYTPTFEVTSLDYGSTYEFAVTPTTNIADGVIVSLTTLGRDTQPVIPDPMFIDALCFYTDKIQLVWQAISDPLLGFFEVRTDLNWGNATNMIYQGKGTSFTYKPSSATITFYLKSHDTFSNYSTGYDSITLTHVVPVPVFVSITGLFAAVRVEWQTINDESYDVVEVWRNSVNARSTATKAGEIHSNVFIDSNRAIGATYYYWLRTRSIFSTYSAWESGESAGHSVVTAAIDTGDLADQAINKFKLANEIVFPEVVTELPTLPDGAYPEGKIVYLTSDGKLYRNDQVGGGGVNASDGFDRSSLGANWTQQPGDSGTVVATGSAYCAASGNPDAFAYWNASSFGNDQLVQVKIQNISNWADDAGPAVRMSDSANTCYRFVWLPGTNRWNLERVSSGSITNLNYATSPTPQNGDIVRITAIGTSIKGYVNGQLVCQATDANIASGQPGIYVGDSTTYLDDWYASEIGGGSIGWSAVVDGADILEGTVSHTALFDQIVAGQIAAGAVGANEIAADSIAAKHMVIGGWGAAINRNPHCDDLTAWCDYSVESNPPNVTVQTLTDGKVGNKCFRSPTNAAVNIVENRFYPVDPDKVYRVKVWARRNIAGNGVFYLCLDLYDSGGSRISGDGSFWYYPASGVTLSTSWTYYSGRFGPGTSKGAIPSNARTMRLGALLNYNGTAGYQEIQDIRVEEVIPGDLIVDGAITAAKVGTNEIIAQTANLKNLIVQTAKIDDNAVTVPVSAYDGSGSIVSSQETNRQAVISASITTHGQPVFINFSCSAMTSTGSFLYVYFFRGSTMLNGSFTLQSQAWTSSVVLPIGGGYVDQPSAGTYTYYVYMSVADSSKTVAVSSCHLTLMEVRK
ncbi:MAG: host specificity factor TipJ family phage tail protein [Deltaproteobacteria bacterium]|nr:host specificity factor TipJ family phage tail protein [Deltaproteobacteria bacterium]